VKLTPPFLVARRTEKRFSVGARNVSTSVGTRRWSPVLGTTSPMEMGLLCAAVAKGDGDVLRGAAR
jgi:hypothetical protein